jgi:hypothetical protein
MAHNRKSSASAVLGMMFLAGCFSGHASSNAAEICASPAVTTKLVKSELGYELIFTVENNTKSVVSLEKFYFGENMLHLRAVSAGRIELKQVVPLLSPGVANIVLAPGENFVHEVNLETSFPDLQQALRTSDVLVSWELVMRGENSCYVQSVNTSMTIGKLD